LQINLGNGCYVVVDCTHVLYSRCVLAISLLIGFDSVILKAWKIIGLLCFIYIR